MTIEEISKTLPNGFHDAQLVGIQIHFELETGSMDLEVNVANSDIESNIVPRRGRLTLTGLLYFVIEPPHPNYSYDRQLISSDSSNFGELATPPQLPELPEGYFAHWFYSSSNNFLYVAAAEAEFNWTEEGYDHR